MEENESKISCSREPDIAFSKAVMAGKRIYYLDVKNTRNNELFLTITESKKVLVNDPTKQSFHFEKHKIFLYKEDFDKFLDALNETIKYAKENNS